jgi:type I restriction enzyme M protein
MSNLKGILDSIRKIMWQDTGLNGDAQRIEQLGWMLFLKIFSDKDKELEIIKDDYESPIPAEFHWDEWAGDDEGITGDELQAFVDQKLFPALRNLKVGASADLANKRALLVREVFEGNNNYMKSGINIRKVLNKLNEIDFNIAKDRHAFGELYETILKELQSAGKSGEFYTPRAITEFICEMMNPKLGEKILDPSCGTGGYLTAAIEHLKKQANSIEERESIAKNIAGWEYKPLPYLLATTNLILHDMEVPNIQFRDSLDQPLSNYTEKNRVNLILANPPFGGIVANNNENNFPQNYRTKESADLFLVMMVHLLKNGGRAGIVLPDGSLTGDGVKQRVREKLLTDCNLHTIIRLPNSVFQPYATVATNLLFFTKGEPTKEIWYYEHRLPEGQKSYSKTRPIKLKEFDPIKKWWNKRVESDVCWKVDFSARLEKAKNEAQPYWELAQAANSKMEALKREIKTLDSQIKEAKDSKKLQETKRIKLELYSKEESIAKTNQQSGDAIYYAAYDLDIKNPTKQEEDIIYSSAELMDMLDQSFSKSHDLLKSLKQAVN